MAFGSNFSLGDAVLNLVGDSSSLNKSLSDADSATQRVLNSMGSKFTSAGKAMTLAGVGVVGGIFGIATAVSSAADNLSEMSDRTGIGVEQLQKLGFAASQTGGSTEELEKAINKMSKGLVGIDEEGKKSDETLKGYANSLKEIGINFKDLERMSPEEKFMAIGDGLARVTDVSKRTGLALELFGRSGTKLLPMFKDGAAGARKMGDELQRMGGVMSKEAVDAAKDFNDEWAKMKPMLLSLGAEGIRAVMPMLDGLREKVFSIIQQVRAWVQEHPKLAASLGEWALKLGLIAVVAGPFMVFLGSAMTMTSGLIGIMLKIPGAFNMAGAAIRTLAGAGGGGFGGLAASIGLVVGVGAIGWQVGRWIDETTANTKFGKWIDAMMDRLVALIQKLKEWFGLSEKAGKSFLGMSPEAIAARSKIPEHLRPKEYASGTLYHPGGMAMIGERGRELVSLPRGSRVHPNNETENIMKAFAGGSMGENITVGDIHIHGVTTDPRSWTDADAVIVNRKIKKALRMRTA